MYSRRPSCGSGNTVTVYCPEPSPLPSSRLKAYTCGVQDFCFATLRNNPSGLSVTRHEGHIIIKVVGFLLHRTILLAASALLPAPGLRGQERSCAMPARTGPKGSVSGRGGSLLPLGLFSTRGAQVIDSTAKPVRIASIGWSGTDSSPAPSGLLNVNYKATMSGMVRDGFNAIRFPWYDLLLDESPTSKDINFSLSILISPVSPACRSWIS